MNIAPGSQRLLDHRSVLELELLNSVNSDTDVLTLVTSKKNPRRKK